MYRNKLQSAIWVIFILFFSAKSNADENKSIINYKIDFENQHIWRGSLTSNILCIAPSAWMSKNNFDFGAWAAQSINGQYSELDLFIKYSIKDFSFSFYDYYCPTEVTSDEFLDYKNSSTKHLFDINFNYNGNQNFPISLLISTMIYGDDKNPNNKENYFSTYVEFGYSTFINNCTLNFFLGLTPSTSFYNKKFGIVNAGISKSTKIKTINNYQIPITTSIITNPQKKTLFLVIGFSI